MPRKIFITGINGFIGSALALRAAREGDRVFGIDQSEARPELTAAGIHPLVGDMLNFSLYSHELEAADVIFHTAAIVSESGDWNLFRRINVDYPVKLYQQLGKGKVFVHFSSVMVYGFQFPHQVKEDGPLRGENNPYCQTKIESERALRAVMRPENPLIIIRPGDVIGPGSRPWVLRPLELMRSGLFALPDDGNGIFNHVHVDNLCDAAFLLIQPENLARCHGESFNVTDGERTTCREYFGLLAKSAGLNEPMRLPGWLLAAAGGALDLWGKLTGTPAAFAPEGIAFLQRNNQYSIEKIRQLGYQPRIRLREAMKQLSSF